MSALLSMQTNLEENKKCLILDFTTHHFMTSLQESRKQYFNAIVRTWDIDIDDSLVCDIIKAVKIYIQTIRQQHSWVLF